MAALLLPGASEERCAQAAEDGMFVARPLTAENSFTSGIEGPACDAQGNIYAVNFERQQTIGKITPDGKGSVWLVLPGESTGNGIRFNTNGTMFVADYVGHKILAVNPMTKAISVFAQQNELNQPKELSIA